MAKAYKCDVCGKYYECTRHFQLAISRCAHIDISYDLCPDCQKELETWLNQGKEKK
jgi:hypothetical protein